jgi:hypothetical protein
MGKIEQTEPLAAESSLLSFKGEVKRERKEQRIKAAM